MNQTVHALVAEINALCEVDVDVLQLLELCENLTEGIDIFELPAAAKVHLQFA